MMRPYLYCLAIVLMLARTSLAQNAPELTFGLANKHTYASFEENETNLVNYFQLGYSHPLTKSLSLSSHLAFFQRHSEEEYLGDFATNLFDESGQLIRQAMTPLYSGNDIGQYLALDLALRWHLVNLPRHQLSLYAGPSLKRMAIMDSFLKRVFTTTQDFEPLTLHQLGREDQSPTLNIGTSSQWAIQFYTALEYVFYPVPQLGIGYTLRIRSPFWFLDEDLSIGPVLRYRLAPNQHEGTNYHQFLSLAVLPTYIYQVDGYGSQFRMQYGNNITERWGARASLTYLQGSQFPEQYAAYDNQYYQYHSTIVAMQASLKLLRQNRSQLGVQFGPAFRWGASAKPEGFYNAKIGNVFQYLPNISEQSPEYIGDYVQVEVEKHQSWGISGSLTYDYQVAEYFTVGAELMGQQYLDQERLVGGGLQAAIWF
ncbi:hypothetical protein [Tunicatimonas pelagia]|uniref:hypothetical protein n=1 Tax=Tunicatimonas pelagia TaxID=931531 RepID=UPI00266693A8|nr:hypothetical protein [Tunicatimonas pelagia]WKN44090.1 hypothetical protein P0M28_03800 [Tunicatimonas pelagia]